MGDNFFLMTPFPYGEKAREEAHRGSLNTLIAQEFSFFMFDL